MSSVEELMPKRGGSQLNPSSHKTIFFLQGKIAGFSKESVASARGKAQIRTHKYQ
jgi:hypothetical protein